MKTFPKELAVMAADATTCFAVAARARAREHGHLARFAATAESYCAGIVTSGSRSALPVSASVKKNITAVSARLACQSLSSTQNQ